ncbi:MAG: UDP-glucose 4-epimerase GalE [Gluconacetobacter diazotrophicus]|nr:UDP-glucose 4-epimerase GalE [Gluconacetobacter diazotrophicus]
MTSSAPPSARGVLVTGGAGYIGSHAVLALLDAGLRPVILDDLSTGSAASVPPGVTLIRGSTGDSRLVTNIARLHDIDSVLHFAASLVVPDSVREPIRYWRNNLGNTAALLEGCVEAGISRIVFSSTAAVYGLSDEPGVSEDTPTAPINPYGASKLATERLLADAAAAHDLRVVALRYFNVAGADPLGRAGQRTRGATHLIKVACEAATGQRPGMDVFGTDYDTPDGTCVRDFIHVSDLADAHVLALDYLRNGGRSDTMNCGYGSGSSVREVIAAVERASNRRITATAKPRRPGDPPSLVANGARIRDRLGWTPRHTDLDDIVSTSLRWERRMQDERQAIDAAVPAAPVGRPAAQPIPFDRHPRPARPIRFTV